MPTLSVERPFFGEGGGKLTSARQEAYAQATPVP